MVKLEGTYELVSQENYAEFLKSLGKFLLHEKFPKFQQTFLRCSWCWCRKTGPKEGTH